MFKSVKIRETLFEEIGKKYKSTGNGLQRLTWLTIKASQVEEAELRKIFTKNEWIGIADAFNGSLIDPEQPFFRKDILVGQMEDAERFENTSSRHGYDFDTLMNKIKNLSEFQAVLVMEMIHRFWNELAHEKGFKYLYEE